MPHTPRRARPVLTFGLARQLAAKHGTPLQVLNRRVLSDTFRTFQASLPGADIRYAVKANRDPALLAHLRGLGSGVDVCTAAEVLACQQAGFPPHLMLHTHPCKTADNLLESIARGVRLFVFDAAYELEKMARHAADSELLLRVAEHSDAELDLSRKFGCDPADAAGLLALARRKGLKVRGLSFHLGSQLLDAAAFGPVLQNMRRLWDAARRAGHRLDTLDIGGGPPAPYRDPPEVPSLRDFLSEAWGHVLAHFGDLRPGQPGGLRVIVEPGRAMAAECMTAVVRVLGKSVRKGKPWYYLDDGVYGTFSGQFFQKNIYPVLADVQGRPVKPCVLAGPTCDSLDIVDESQAMPGLEVGELLLVPSVGAYSLACASTFNGLPLPKVAAIDDDPALED